MADPFAKIDPFAKKASSYDPFAKREEEEETRGFWDTLFGQGIAALGASTARLPQRGVDVLDFASQLGSRITDPLGIYDAPRKKGLEQLRRAAEITEPLAQRIEPDAPETFAEEVAQGVGGSLPDLAAVLASGGAGAFPMAAGLAGGASLREAQDRGVDPEAALAKAATSAVLTGGLEALGAKALRHLFKGVPANKKVEMGKRLVEPGLIEPGTEASQELVEILGEAATGVDHPEGSVGRRLAVAAATGGTVAGGAGAGATVYRGLRGELGMPDVEDTVRGLKRQFGTRRGLPEPVLQQVEKFNQNVEADRLEAGQMRREYSTAKQQALQANPGIDSIQLDEDMHVYLTDPMARQSIRANPEYAEVIPVVEKMRQRIDARSQQLIDSGFLTDEQIETLRENQGAYAARQYNVFEDPQGQREIVDPKLGADPEIWSDVQEWLLTDPEFQKTLKAAKVDPTSATAYQMADRKIRTLLNNIELKGDSSPFALGQLGAIERGPFKHRKDVPEVLRRLYGEYRAPEVVYPLTIERMSRAYHKAKMYDAIVESGNGMFFARPESVEGTLDIDEPVDLVLQGEAGNKTALEILALTPHRNVKGKESEPHPLHTNRTVDLKPGKRLYMERNLFEVFDAGFDSLAWLRNMASKPEGPALAKAAWKFVQASGAAKGSMVVFRPQTQLRNAVWSNPLAFLAGGNALLPGSPGEGATVLGLTAAGAALGGLPGAAVGAMAGLVAKPVRQAAQIASAKAGFTSGKKTLESLIQPGQRATAGELATLFEREGFSGGNVDVNDIQYFIREFEEAHTRRRGEPAERSHGEQFFDNLMKVSKTMQSSYVFGDDVWKIAAGIQEAHKLRWAFKEDLDAGRITEEQIRAEAAEITKRTMQNYERLPRIIQTLRAAPFIAPFIAFPVASAINLKNQIQRGFQELGTSSQFATPDAETSLLEGRRSAKTRAIGAYRLGSTAGAVLAGPGLMAATLKSLYEMLSGNEEEEVSEQDRLDVEQALPWYLSGSKIQVLGRDPESPARWRYADVSFMDYFNVLSGPFIAAMRAGEVDKPQLAAAMAELAEPFIAPDILTKGLIEALGGERDFKWVELLDEGGEISPEFFSTGSEIYKGMEGFEAFQRGIQHLLYSTLGPVATVGRLTSAATGQEGSYGRELDWATELSAQGGPRMSVVDFGENLQRKSRWMKARLSEYSSNAHAAMGFKKDLTQDTIERKFQLGHEELAAHFKVLERAYGSATRHGISRETAIQYLENSGLPKKYIGMLLSDLTPEQVASRILIPAAGRIMERRRERQMTEINTMRRRAQDDGLAPYEIQEREQEINDKWGEEPDFSFLEQYLANLAGGP